MPDKAPQLAAYPRGEVDFYGTGRGLKAAYDAYQRVGLVFVCSLLAWAFMAFVALNVTTFSLILTVPGLAFIVGSMSHDCAQNVAIATGRNESFVKSSSIVIGLLAPFGLSIFGLAYLQSIAQQELRRYGVFNRLNWISHKKLMAAFDALQAKERAEPATETPAEKIESYRNRPVPKGKAV